MCAVESDYACKIVKDMLSHAFAKLEQKRIQINVYLSAMCIGVHLSIAGVVGTAVITELATLLHNLLVFESQVRFSFLAKFGPTEP